MISLLEHQKEHAKYHLTHSKSCNFSEQGTGKTYTAIAAIVSHHFCERALIVCPKHLIDNWVDACVEYGVPREQIFVFQGSIKQREKQKQEMVSEKYSIWVTNYGHFRIEKKFFVEMVKDTRTLVVADEAHCLGKKNTKITKAFDRVVSAGKYVLFMTGTPITNSPLRVYPLLSMCDPTLYSSKRDFLNAHAIEKTIRVPGKYGKLRPVRVVESWKNFSLLYKNMAKVSVRITKDECIDLPERVFVTRRYEITPLQKKMYKQALEQLIVEMTSGEVKALVNPLAKAMLLREILGNPELVDPEIKIPSYPKEEILLKDTEDYPGKIVIFCSFVGTFNRLLNLFGEQAVGVRGGEKDMRGKLKRFNEDDDCRFFIGVRQACYTGLNLQVSHVLINYELDYDALMYNQGIDRIHRRGQEHKVTVIDYIAKISESFDLKILNSLRAKEAISNEVLKNFMRKELVR